ncbi:MAG: hypothetical protein PHQ74_04210 [Crocinitomicaceae bacterium]|nr:hypothetical protein [Crocinitomicaceae bacterium]
MEYFGEFLGKYLFYIWLGLAILLFTFLITRGKKVLKQFVDIDFNKIVYSEKNASGHVVRQTQTRRAGTTKMLHIIITDQELIFKTNLFFAHIAHENDMLHRIPLGNIMQTEFKKGRFSSKLYVKFRTIHGDEKVVILQSKNNLRMQSILEQYI